MAKPTKAKAIERLKKALDAIPEIEPLLEDDSLEFQKWRRGIQGVIADTFGARSPHIRDFADSLDRTYSSYRMDDDDIVRDLEPVASILKSMLEEIEEYWEDKDRVPSSSRTQRREQPSPKEIFVIHGRNNEAKETVARFLQNLGLTPVILHEQPNQGRTIIEKFERHAQVGFAVALLTPDDVGALKNEEKNLKPRARQNVVFELGYFLGRLGRERVCALTKGNVELPSNYDGVVYISLDDGGWKMNLIRELKNADFNVDANKVL